MAAKPKRKRKRNLVFRVVKVVKGSRVPKWACTFNAHYYPVEADVWDAFNRAIRPRVNTVLGFKREHTSYLAGQIAPVDLWAVICEEVEPGPPEWGEFAP